MVRVLFGLCVCLFSAYAELPAATGFGPLRAVNEAPEAIKNAAKAIVKIRTRDGAGTGFFILGGDVFLTNNHVVGPENCSLEGCFAELDLNFAHGEKPESKKVFLVPFFRDGERDLTAFEVYTPSKENPKAERYKSPNALEFSAKPGALLEKNLYLIGHGLGGLKRWSEDTPDETFGDWIYSDHCSLPGCSGSPMLNAEGKIEGLVHSGLRFSEETIDLASPRSLAVFTEAKPFLSLIQESSAETRKNTLEEFVSLPLSGEMDLEDVSNLALIMDVMLGRGLGSVKALPGKGKKKKKESEVRLVADLLKVCESEVENEDHANDPQYTYEMCEAARAALICAKDDKYYTPSLCPTTEEQETWAGLYEEIAELVQLKNEDPIEWQLAAAIDFAPSREDMRKRARVKLLEILETRKLNTFETLQYIATTALTKEDMVYKGTDYLEVLTNYTKYPRYRLGYENIALALESLADHPTKPFLTKPELQALFTTFLQDPKALVTLKAELESFAYEHGLE